MGFFDKAKRMLGLGGGAEDEAPESAPPAAKAEPRDARGGRGRDRKDRPPLQDLPPAQGQTVDDALAAREAGDPKEARKILEQIDRGKGLRTVLRAAAALEAGDEAEVRSLLAAVAAEAEGWKLPLQIAGALGDPAEAAPWIARAVAEKAPAWVLAWTRAASSDATEQREGLVELLFTDAPLARTVAARDLGAAGVVADPDAIPRHAAFAHGRDSIRRFGAAEVAKLVRRAVGGAS